MTTTDLSIVNTALIIMGADEIVSFDDATAEAKLASAVYQDTKFMLLQSHPWRFSLRQKDLGGALLASPEFKWTYKYQVPPDLLRIMYMKDSADYEVFEGDIYTNQPVCKIVYQFKVVESDMPSYFVRCLQYHLTKIFASSLQEDLNKMQLFDTMADKETARARNIDSQQQPAQAIPDNVYSLINVRH